MHIFLLKEGEDISAHISLVLNQCLNIQKSKHINKDLKTTLLYTWSLMYLLLTYLVNKLPPHKAGEFDSLWS